MARLDRIFADYRAQAARTPVTRAAQEHPPQIELPGGIAIGLSLNK